MPPGDVLHVESEIVEVTPCSLTLLVARRSQREGAPDLPGTVGSPD
jgi:hypothetical protein